MPSYTTEDDKKLHYKVLGDRTMLDYENDARRAIKELATMLDVSPAIVAAYMAKRFGWLEIKG